MYSFGHQFRITIFGESHGPGIGVTIDGVPAGTSITKERLQERLDRRKPGTDQIHSQRRESDVPRIYSGVREGKTTGAPVTILIENEDARSKHYRERKDTPRPGHADYTSWLKYGEHRDWRGGGHFSGRLTAPIVAAGAVAEQLMENTEVNCISHTRRIGSVESSISPEEVSEEKVEPPVYCPEEKTGEKMREHIDETRKAQNSLGGIVETIVQGVPGGLGEVFFGRFDARASHLCMAIPAVKGIEFGKGFEAAEMKGSEHNDPFVIENGEIVTETNHAGGVLGGITTGSPVVFRVVVKPTSSISRKQKTVNLKSKEPEEIQIKGRHDPCIVTRAVPVMEACAEILMADFLMMQQAEESVSPSDNRIK